MKVVMRSTLSQLSAETRRQVAEQNIERILGLNVIPQIVGRFSLRQIAAQRRIETVGGFDSSEPISNAEK
jgi:hypothetical protein